MPARPWYPKNPGDYRRDTADLELEEHGAYNLLLDYAWDHDGLIPTDMRRIGKILSVHTNKAKTLWGSLARFWFETPHGFRNKRIDKELRKAIDFSEKQRKNARKRWDAMAMPTHMPNACSPQPQPHKDREQEPPAPKARPVDKSKGNGSGPTVWDVARKEVGGPYLGKLLRAYPEHEVEAAILATLKKRPAEWKSYLTGVLKAGGAHAENGRDGGRRLTAPERVERAIAERNRRREQEGRTFEGEFE